jgi:hypothetical protein
MGGPFREALRVIAERPVLLLSGAGLGVIFSTGLVLQLYLGSFIAERLIFLSALALPFILGGAYGVVQGEEHTLRAYFREGAMNYFRILLPVIVVIFAAFLTLILLSLPLSLLGIGTSEGGILTILTGVAVPFLFLTYFSDVAAVVEGTGVFESIRRGIQCVVTRPVQVCVFYVTTFLVAVPAATFIALVTELVLFAHRPDLMEAVSSGNVTAVQGLQPAEIIAALGADGVWIYALTTMIVLIPVGTVLTVYKVCFFRGSASRAPAPVGEYDEKGRWYRY